ncbi:MULTISPECIES: type II toxin-antitoxin system death-on-curing family toxin [Burkholderia]|uniref:type II toxin-antitoxin system death-on-curing family toxin n=1 Tax=Burkholderia TaxID=32008 RepID=UPI0005E80DE2|nr:MULTISPECIES: type II toxin-antitoxin system death-on-curing family toxin [Burkholderia]MBF3568621.1 type II toxin-antitoxin system death-on-curing family toxin [Burkholderia pseudomallei]TOY78219.1 type II toxin-antitoxin system death-on-curing family toxin [Burkholderia pseudomallei]TPB79211.1 type II toxin-antitoxin system death-on-curing family toxin [Burkholderia pseudomallei]CAJ3014923.1 death-on-curing family protein [Burkholderia pseudomallei]CAJ3341202.1 death-on-curing family prot
MKKTNLRHQSAIRTISSDEVLSIHELLALDMANSGDAISPAGVKNEVLLHSAVGRQTTGFGDKLKYNTVEANAATLCYGICCNHPFHNGNKRTALVAMLSHLDRNDRTFDSSVSQDNLYELMKKVAGHGFVDPKCSERDQSDAEVEAIASWLRKRTRRVERSERLVTYRELRTILGRYGFQFENLVGNRIDIVKYDTIAEGSWFFKREKVVKRRVARIGWPRDGATVSKQVLRDLRRECELTEEHGVDSTGFYASERPVDYFLMHYSSVLRRLAKT